MNPSSFSPAKPKLVKHGNVTISMSIPKSAGSFALAFTIGVISGVWLAGRFMLWIAEAERIVREP